MALGDSEFRTRVVAESIRLFTDNGYESTTVEQIAAAAGVSRRTLFRQFRSKEDVIFADHESLLTEVDDFLTASDPLSDDPWLTVCAAAEIVFGHFLGSRDLAVRRIGVVQEVPALRDRELVTTYRYQRLFEDFLRARRPDEPPVHLVTYAAAVTGTHNYLLRRMIRGDAGATLERLRSELARVHAALGAGSATVPAAIEPRTGSDHVVTVVTYPVGTPPADIADQLTRQLAADPPIS
ncbi:TetR/AcrR family transcriptional regulator [Gordonia sp. ABSL1-1]|uniref:TetR/AcrR family transcriptional regulator n=1 Tax=Gordonia sp. ABSL1-1 TaxID=3053923 RepID=UPI0025723834|nr:TetR/AcrR family transcriptional regulator [Gordonia sp. ABSL1-1]MDL9936096.1 TetR/AcrR family transcriptional regulator [Gordonia sp. ABSL1-1]